MFRQVLADKMTQCGIAGEAMTRYRQRTGLLLKKERDRMNKLIEEHGGLPNRLEGMTTTCHEQQSSPAYVQLRAKLEAYGTGKTAPDSIIPGDCDATTFAP